MTEKLARALCDAESDNMRSARCQEDGWCGSPRCQMGKLVPQLLACLQEQGLAIVPLEDLERLRKVYSGMPVTYPQVCEAVQAMLAARDEG